MPSTALRAEHRPSHWAHLGRRCHLPCDNRVMGDQHEGHLWNACQPQRQGPASQSRCKGCQDWEGQRNLHPHPTGHGGVMGQLQTRGASTCGGTQSHFSQSDRLASAQNHVGHQHRVMCRCHRRVWLLASGNNTPTHSAVRSTWGGRSNSLRCRETLWPRVRLYPRPSTCMAVSKPANLIVPCAG